MPTPGMPTAPAVTEIETSPLSDVYTLFYIRGGDPHTRHKNFRHNGDLRSAILKAQAYCGEVSYRCIRVESFLSDLDSELTRSRGQV
jgi:hypothetical protein